jgi:fatty-acyl-CoA synthase
MASHNIPDVGLGRMIATRAALTPDNRALTFEGVTWNYAELLERIDRFAASLRDKGVSSGDRVAYLGFNHPAFLVSMFAAMRIGASFVPLNFRLTSSELNFIINDSGVHTVLADDTHKAALDEIRNQLPCKRFVGSESASDGWESLEQIISSNERLTQGVHVDADDVALIMYTSGTTGQPKGAMLTHGNIAWNNVNSLHSASVGERTLVVAPLFHIGGLNVTTLVTMQRGGEVVLHRNFDPGAALEAIERHGIATMFGVPAMFLFMQQHPNFDATDFSSVTLFTVGGAPVPEPLLNAYNARGIPFAQGYGLTETSPFVAILEPQYASAKLGSAGKSPLYSELAVLDVTGSPCEPGVRGEVCARGPNVMAGYWNQPAATADAIDERGWFHSGDVGYFDDDGFVYVVDRLKDMIISGGENVYPAEVESVLYDHPSVSEVAIIGAPDERWGEGIIAVVALKEGQELTLDELRDFGAARLARYKLPVRLETIDALPRNPAGKVLKFKLREQFH